MATDPASSPPAPNRNVHFRGWLGRFALVGLAATATDVGLLVLLWRAGLALLVADLAAIAVAALLTSVAHRLFSFQNDPFVRWVHQPSAFVPVAALAGGIDMLVLAVNLKAGAGIVAAKIGAVAGAAVIRVLAYRWVLFQGTRQRQVLRVDRPDPPGSCRLSVVIPAYCEEERIAATIAELRGALGALHRDSLAVGGVEILVVDDGSPDATAAAAERAAAEGQGSDAFGTDRGDEVPVRVLAQGSNRGKGAAVRAGMLAARGRAVAFTDADLAYSPDQLLSLLDAIEDGWDMVVGSRHHPATTTVTPTSRLRELGSRVINLFTMALLLGQYRDTQCGLKAFRSDVARLLFSQTRVDGFAFDVELFHLAERYELSLYEVPVRVQNSERSTVRVARDAARLVRDLLKIRGWAKRGAYQAPWPPPPPLGERTPGASAPKVGGRAGDARR